MSLYKIQSCQTHIQAKHHKAKQIFQRELDIAITEVLCYFSTRHVTALMKMWRDVSCWILVDKYF